MFTRAVATVWASMGARGILFIVVTAIALPLVIQSGFSAAIWGNNRDSPLFVLIGLAAFGGAVLTVFWALAFVINVMIAWVRLTRGPKQNFETQRPMVSPAVKEVPAKPVMALNTVAATHSLGYLPIVVGGVCAVIGMVVSTSAAKGAQVITAAGQLAGFGFMVGYPVGLLIRAAIRWSKTR